VSRCGDVSVSGLDEVDRREGVNGPAEIRSLKCGAIEGT